MARGTRGRRAPILLMTGMRRIASECYRPNGPCARSLTVKGRSWASSIIILHISFNFGPTLFPWLEKKFPFVYRRDSRCRQRKPEAMGHGNGLARFITISSCLWQMRGIKRQRFSGGFADFEKRFHRRPEALWLPETAVNQPTLRVLVKHGIDFSS